MADIAGAIIAYALQDDSIGSLMGTRIYLDKAPDNIINPTTKTKLSFAILSEIDNAAKWTQDGRGPRDILFQIDLYHNDSVVIDTIADLFESRFDGFRGLMATVVVGRCFARRVNRNWSPANRRFRRVLELKVGTNA